MLQMAADVDDKKSTQSQQFNIKKKRKFEKNATGISYFVALMLNIDVPFKIGVDKNTEMFSVVYSVKALLAKWYLK